MKILPNQKSITNDEFETYLRSIGGLQNGYRDIGPIITNLCECGEGWLLLIKNLINELIGLGWTKEINQIKEKFGELCFYSDTMTLEMWDVVGKYAKQSIHTCELCGDTRTAQKRGRSWIRCLCNKCNEK